MQIDPLLAGLTPSSPIRSRVAEEEGDSAAFGEALRALMVGLDRASTETVDALWVLKDRLLTPSDGWYQNQTITNLPADIAARDVMLADFTKAIQGVLQDYGISTNTEIRMAIGDDGRVHVTSGHPNQAAIEDLINGSALLSDAVARILADTHRITMASLAQKGKATVELSEALRQNITLVLSRSDRQVIGEVRYNGSVLATTDRNGNWSDMLAALERANDAFDLAERERRIEYDHAMAQLKREDEFRRSELQMAKDDDLAEKLSDQEAAERRERLHPEQGHTPVFI